MHYRNLQRKYGVIHVYIYMYLPWIVFATQIEVIKLSHRRTPWKTVLCISKDKSSQRNPSFPNAHRLVERWKASIIDIVRGRTSKIVCLAWLGWDKKSYLFLATVLLTATTFLECAMDARLRDSLCFLSVNRIPSLANPLSTWLMSLLPIELAIESNFSNILSLISNIS